MEDIKKVVEGAEAYVKPSMEVIDLGKKNDILTGSIPEEKEIEITPTPVPEVTPTPVPEVTPTPVPGGKFFWTDEEGNLV